MELQNTPLTTREGQTSARYPDLILQKGSITSDYGRADSNNIIPVRGSQQQSHSSSSSSERCGSCNRRKFGSCSCQHHGDEIIMSPSPERTKQVHIDEVTVKVDDGVDITKARVSVKLDNRLEDDLKCERKWEYFPGKNKFYFDGRLITAPSIRFCMLSFMLILVTFSLFTVFDGPFLAERLTIAIPIIGCVLFLLVIVNMFKTSCSDPGILPRASAQESEFIEKSYASANGLRPPPRTKDIIVNGQTIKSKYCFTCKMFRPPRASHCGVCDNCVDRFDHHCPFLGNCIGKRNYRNFYTFIVSLSLLAVFVLSCSITKLALIGKEKGNFLDALRDSPTSAVVILISFFGMWTVIGLAGFHSYLIAVEQTTNEDIKGIFGRSNTVNPYTKGNMCHNCCFILCGPHHPSLIDSRGLVTPDFLTSLPKKSGGNEITTPPQCSLPPASMRSHCGDGPNTPRSDLLHPHEVMTPSQTMYQITALDSGGHKLNPGPVPVTTNQPSMGLPRHSTVSIPKAGTVPVQSGVLGFRSTMNSSLSFQPTAKPSAFSPQQQQSTSGGGSSSSSNSRLLSKSQNLLPHLDGGDDDEAFMDQDMSLSMVHLDYPEYTSPPPLRTSHRRPAASSSSTSSVPLMRAAEEQLVKAGYQAPGTRRAFNSSRSTAPAAPPVSAADAPVALALDPVEAEQSTMMNSPLHLDSIS